MKSKPEQKMAVKLDANRNAFDFQFSLAFVFKASGKNIGKE